MSPLLTVYVAPVQVVGVGVAPDVVPLQSVSMTTSSYRGQSHEVIHAVDVAMGVAAKLDFPHAEVKDVKVFAKSVLDCSGI